MLKSSDLKTNARFPKWISEHPVFKKHSSFNKIFPEIGLSNQKVEIQIDNSNEIRETAKTLIKEFDNAILNRLSTITRYAEIKASVPFGKTRSFKYQTCIHILKALRSAIAVKGNRTPIRLQGNKLSLVLPCKITTVDNEVVFKDGEGLFKVYNKLNEMLRNGHFLAMPSYEKFISFKNFSTVNVPKLKFNLTFSSDGIDGAWDIATMGMRGIQSCQSWGQTNSTHIVGSIVDPFTAIIYISSNAKHSEFGSRMIRRCIVRYVIGKKTKRPCLMLEKMYPGYDKATSEEFVKFLREKTDGKFPIFFSSQASPEGATYIPLSNFLNDMSTYDQPYRDSGVPYELDHKDPAIISAEVTSLLSCAVLNMIQKTKSIWSKVKLSDLQKEDRNGLRCLKSNMGLASKVEFIKVRTDIDWILLSSLKEIQKQIIVSNPALDPWTLASLSLKEIKPLASKLIEPKLTEFFNLRNLNDNLKKLMLLRAEKTFLDLIDKEIEKLELKAKEFAPSIIEPSISSIMNLHHKFLIASIDEEKEAA